MGVNPQNGLPQSVLTTSAAPTIINAGNLGATYTLDMTGLHDALVVGTLTANCTISVINESSGCQYEFALTQDATGGRTVTFPAAVYPTGKPAVDPTPNNSTVVSFWYDGTSRYSVGGSGVSNRGLIASKLYGAQPTYGSGAVGPTITTAGSGVSVATLASQAGPTDMAGSLDITCSAAPAAGLLALVTLGNGSFGYGTEASHRFNVILTPLNQAAYTAQVYPATAAGTPGAFSGAFNVACWTAPAANAHIQVAYMVVG